jgi:phage tail sheath protein FI
MTWRPPQNPLDKPLEDAVADAVTVDLIDGNVVALDRRDLARRAALEGFRQAIDLSRRTLDEMAADHE